MTKNQSCCWKCQQHWSLKCGSWENIKNEKVVPSAVKFCQHNFEPLEIITQFLTHPIIFLLARRSMAITAQSCPQMPPKSSLMQGQAW
jgi:hypothetical protein